MDRDDGIATAKGGCRQRDARIIVGISLVLAVVAILGFMVTLPG